MYIHAISSNKKQESNIWYRLNTERTASLDRFMEEACNPTNGIKPLPSQDIDGVINWMIMKRSPDCSSPSCQGLAHRDPPCNFQPSLKCETLFNLNPYSTSKNHILALADLHQCNLWFASILILLFWLEEATWQAQNSQNLTQYCTILVGMAGPHTILSDVNFSIVCFSYRCHPTHHQPYPSLLRKCFWAVTLLWDKVQNLSVKWMRVLRRNAVTEDFVGVFLVYQWREMPKRWGLNLWKPWCIISSMKDGRSTSTAGSK